MEYNEENGKKEYFKIVLVKIRADEYNIIKGPEEERRLVRVLQDDYNSTRYEKIIQLLSMEVIQKEYKDSFCSIFSIENIRREFQSGKSMMECSYIRNIDGELRRVNTRIYPRAKQGAELEEFMVYVAVQDGLNL